MYFKKNLSDLGIFYLRGKKPSLNFLENAVFSGMLGSAYIKLCFEKFIPLNSTKRNLSIWQRNTKDCSVFLFKMQLNAIFPR